MTACTTGRPAHRVLCWALDGEAPGDIKAALQYAPCTSCVAVRFAYHLWCVWDHWDETVIRKQGEAMVEDIEVIVENPGPYNSVRFGDI